MSTDLLPQDYSPVAPHQIPASMTRPPVKAIKIKPFQKQTAIIFDWDDTLLASTVLCAAGITLQSTEMLKDLKLQFQQLEVQVMRVLARAIESQSRIFLITNAESGWVELSAQKFMPRVVPYLERTTIVSARSTYQHLCLNNPNQWKATAFTEKICCTFPKTSEMNVISFGDSECERNALLGVGRLCTASRTKSIKFVERPTIEQLRRQLEMIYNNFQFILQHDGNLDLMLTISTAVAPAPPIVSNEMVPLPNVLPAHLPPAAPVPVAGLGNGLGK
eukprot:GAFH01002281.1.p1 GENE.GAFH01002281.1~~GAFH01002281.1.p1  ORF type:complete len:276 (-),score=58.17 GAFH01002281.1:301-1128(-)